MERRDSRFKYPSAMEEYLSEYGYHFDERLYHFAVSMMRDRNGNPLQAWDKDKTESFLRSNGVQLKNNLGHDAAYVLSMARADYFGSSIVDDAHLAKYVSDYLDDIDGAKTRAFDEFYIKTVALGIPIFFDEML